MKRHKFFKITFPNEKSVAVVSKSGYLGLIDLCSGVDGKAYIIPISLFELIQYAMSKGD